MNKPRILLTLGVWMVILPYLGFPYAWKDFLIIVSGLILVLFSYTLYRDSIERKIKQKVFDNFSENNFNQE